MLPTVRIEGQDIEMCRAIAELLSGTCDIYNIKHEVAGHDRMPELQLESLLDTAQDAGDLNIAIVQAPPDLWSVDLEYPRDDWQWAVGQGDTNLGYWDWTRQQRESDHGR